MASHGVGFGLGVSSLVLEVGGCSRHGNDHAMCPRQRKNSYTCASLLLYSAPVASVTVVTRCGFPGAVAHTAQSLSMLALAGMRTTLIVVQNCPLVIGDPLILCSTKKDRPKAVACTFVEHTHSTCSDKRMC